MREDSCPSDQHVGPGGGAETNGAVVDAAVDHDQHRVAPPLDLAHLAQHLWIKGLAAETWLYGQNLSFRAEGAGGQWGRRVPSST